MPASAEEDNARLGQRSGMSPEQADSRFDEGMSAWESRLLSGSSRANTPLDSRTCCGLTEAEPSLLAAARFDLREEQR